MKKLLIAEITICRRCIYFRYEGGIDMCVYDGTAKRLYAKYNKRISSFPIPDWCPFRDSNP